MDKNINIKNIPIFPVYISQNNLYKTFSIFLSRYYEFLLTDNDIFENIKNDENFEYCDNLILSDGTEGYILILKNKKIFQKDCIWKWRLISKCTKRNELLDNTIIYNKINGKFLFTQLNEIIKKIFKE